VVLKETSGYRIAVMTASKWRHMANKYGTVAHVTDRLTDVRATGSLIAIDCMLCIHCGLKRGGITRTLASLAKVYSQIYIHGSTIHQPRLFPAVVGAYS